jgi:hypothetical protein
VQVDFLHCLSALAASKSFCDYLASFLWFKTIKRCGKSRSVRHRVIRVAIVNKVVKYDIRVRFILSIFKILKILDFHLLLKISQHFLTLTPTGLGSALARKISLARQACQAWQVFGKASKFFSGRFISIENFFKNFFDVN